MLEAIGPAVVVPHFPQRMIRAFDITGRTTGRDIIAYFERVGVTLPVAAITDNETLEFAKKHPLFDPDGRVNLFLRGGLDALSVIRDRTWRGRPIVHQRICLHSRIPWVRGRVFAQVKNPLPA